MGEQHESWQVPVDDTEATDTHSMEGRQGVYQTLVDDTEATDTRTHKHSDRHIIGCR